MSNTNRRKAKKIAEDVLIPLMAERDAALARNAELEAQLGPQSQTQSLTYRERLELMRASFHEAKAELDALRAELDNLRNRVNALADLWDDCAYAYRQSDPLHHTYKGLANRLRTALVRGSDDEAKP